MLFMLCRVYSEQFLKLFISKGNISLAKQTTRMTQKHKSAQYQVHVTCKRTSSQTTSKHRS